MSRDQALRGITNRDLLAAIKKAIKMGWEIDEGRMKAGRCYIFRPDMENVRVAYSPQSADRNAGKTLARDVERATGQVLFPRANAGKHKTLVNRARYIDTKQTPKLAALSDEIEKRTKEYRMYALEFAIILSDIDGEMSNEDMNRLFWLARKRHQLRKFFIDFNQPIPELEGGLMHPALPADFQNFLEEFDEETYV